MVSNTRSPSQAWMTWPNNRPSSRMSLRKGSAVSDCGRMAFIGRGIRQAKGCVEALGRYGKQRIKQRRPFYAPILTARLAVQFRHGVLPRNLFKCAHAESSTSRAGRSEEHTSELQSRENLVCRLLL